MNEASARIKINKLLESAGWRFFADGKRPANIQLERKYRGLVPEYIKDYVQLNQFAA